MFSLKLQNKNHSPNPDYRAPDFDPYFIFNTLRKIINKVHSDSETSVAAAAASNLHVNTWSDCSRWASTLHHCGESEEETTRESLNATNEMKHLSSQKIIIGVGSLLPAYSFKNLLPTRAVAISNEQVSIIPVSQVLKSTRSATI